MFLVPFSFTLKKCLRLDYFFVREQAKVVAIATAIVYTIDLTHRPSNWLKSEKNSGEQREEREKLCCI